MSDDLTLVSLSWRKRRRNHRLLFGTPERIIRLDWQRSLAAFIPNSIFAYERWEANKYGTVHWSIHVAQSTRSGALVSNVQGIRPGADILFVRRGKPACKSLFSIFDQLRELGKIERVSSEDWRQIGHRLACGLPAEETLDRIMSRC